MGVHIKMDLCEQFRQAIESAGLIPPREVIADGALHRFSSNGKRGDDAGWYLLHDDGRPAGSFGDWRSGVSETWTARGVELTQEERAAHRARVEAARREREANEAKRRAEAAAKAAQLWKASTPAKQDHPYLRRKEVSPTDTLREIHVHEAEGVLGYAPAARGQPLAGRLLVAPVKVGEALSTCELIDQAGRKSAIAGGAKKGGFWAAQPLPEGDGEGVTLLIGEGVATVLSAREGTGHPAVAALSCGNLRAVAEAMRSRYPKAVVTVLADIVKDTSAPDPHAREAARAVGGKLAVPDFGENRPEGCTDFNDLHTVRGLEAVGAAITGAQALTSAKVAGWPDPHPLAAKIDPEPYPVDALPSAVLAAVEEVTAFVQAPLPMAATSALAAVALASQAHIDVRRAERLEGPTGLFLLTIADSGERKTTLDGFFTRAIRDYEAEQVELGEPVLKEYRAALEAWEAKRSGIKDKLRQLAKMGKPTGDMESALRELELAKPEPARIPRLVLGDETPENLAWSLAKNWPSAGVISSEAGLIFGAHGMGRDSIMRNLGLLNTLWDGGSLSVGRKTSESFTVRDARLTVALQIQEPTLRDFFTRSGTLARGTGFLARFLVAWPESTQGRRMFTEAPKHWPHLAAFHRRIAAILNQPVPINDDGTLSPTMLELSPEAKAAWVAFHDAIEGELASGGELYDVRDCASKIADNAARLAALFHAFEDESGGMIGVDSVERATRITAWHLHEARRFFGEIALPPELADAVRLDGWLIEYGRRERTSTIPTREAQRLGPIRVKDRLSAGLRELEELERVRVEQEGRRRTIKVNPALMGDEI
jgi:putative DNA primase/helicase